jgi:hypothetical protein
VMNRAIQRRITSLWSVSAPFTGTSPGFLKRGNGIRYKSVARRIEMVGALRMERLQNY